VWQSLANSLLGVAASPPSEYLWKTFTYWSRQCLTALPPSSCNWTVVYFFDTSCTSSYVLNYGVTGLNRTKILHKIENWSPINMLISKFQYTKPFSSPAWRMDDDRQIEAELQRNFHFPIFTNILHDINGISGAIKSCIYKALVHSVSERQSNDCNNFDVCQNARKLIGYHSNVPWATAKLMPVL